ncbi:MAG: Ribosomal RNA small subunit methyltransferase A [Candidatus Azambacteria bacterium GW2011_GWA2_42_62]|nr:MAG: Ribosomal RNA small subunit methyltransferase A [Candidatus Azambacteria bacterium GW2011_GWA2_42_62]
MDLTNKTVIKDLLKKYGGTAEKKFGQHFILSKKALAKMIAAAEIKKGDTIVEIGPGLGTLTQELAKSGVKITAIEKDPIMAAILNETLKDFKNVKIIKADARQLSINNGSNDPKRSSATHRCQTAPDESSGRERSILRRSKNY